MLLADTVYIHDTAQTGIGIGAAVAVACSWHRNRSIILASIAGLFSWFYVIYYAITRRPDEYRG